MEKYQLYTSIALILFTFMPIAYLGGNLFTSHGRGEFLDRPLLTLYAIVAPLYFYTFWFKPEILQDFFHMNVLAQIIVYFVLCFAVILKTEPPE